MRTGSSPFFSNAASIATIAISCDFTRSSPPYLALSQYHEFRGRQLFGAHRSVGVQARGRDADLRSQPQLTAVGEAGGGVDHHCRGIDVVDEALGRLRVAGDD